MIDALLVSNTDLFFRSPAIYRLATHARAHGYRVRTISFIERASTDHLRQYAEWITSETKILGISSTLLGMLSDKGLNFFSSERLKNNLLGLVALAKWKNPNIRIVMGGSQVYYASQHQLDALTWVDHFVDGEGEANLIRLLASAAATSKSTEADASYAFSTDNSSDIQYEPSDTLLENECLAVETARGCVFKCSFCMYKNNGKSWGDYTKLMSVLDRELKSNYDRWGTVDYEFTDDTFNDDTDRLQSIATVINALPFKIGFSCHARLDVMYGHPEQIEILKDMGLKEVFFGIETFDKRAGSAIKKGLAAEKQKETLYRCQEVWENKIGVSAGFIVGLPFETEESLYATHDWLKTKGCPIDLPNFVPLYVPKSRQPSDIFLNQSQFGVTIVDSKWTHETMKQDRARDLARAFMLSVYGGGVVDYKSFMYPFYVNVGLKDQYLADVKSRSASYLRVREPGIDRMIVYHERNSR